MMKLFDYIIPQFIKGMVSTGFWWTILAYIIIYGVFRIFGKIFKKEYKLLQSIIETIPIGFFTFYIWNIRGHKGWLFLTIFWAITSILAIGNVIINNYAQNSILGKKIAKIKLANAISYNNETIVRKLYDNKNYQDILYDFGFTPVMLALRYKRYNILKFLIKFGDINARLDNGSTALFITARSGDYEGFRIIIEANPDVNLTNDANATPLMEASAKGNINMVKELLKLGADKTIKDDEGNTALEYAKESGYNEIVDLLTTS